MRVNACTGIREEKQTGVGADTWVNFVSVILEVQIITTGINQ